MTHTNTLAAATAAADAVIADYRLGSTTVVTGAGGTHTLRQLLTAAVEADRNARINDAVDIAQRVVYSNYGPEGDIEVFRQAEMLVMIGVGDATDVDTKTLLGAALSTGHLDADGIFALLKETAR